MDHMSPFLLITVTATIFLPITMAAATTENPIQECMKNLDQSYIQFQKLIMGIKKKFESNPCVKCVCSYEGKSQVCRIAKTQCPRLSCSLQEAKATECCRKCKGCHMNGIYHNDGDRWKDDNNTCAQYECNEGIISHVTPKCIAICPNPVNIPGKCCPVCKGCQYKRILIDEGRSLKDGPCINCQCKKGMLQCKKKVCPYLHCKNPITKKGYCCPSCSRTNHPTIVNWKEPKCNIKEKKLEDREKHQLDKCTTCECKNGTVLCKKEECNIDKTCPVQDLVHSPKHCCPICASKLTCKYNGRKHKNKEIWYLPGCVECYCNDGLTMCKKQLCSKEIKCKEGYTASYTPGSCCLQCVPEQKTCIGFGDPHYRTFDGKAYSYQGVCKYTFAKDCSDEKLFHVIGRNHARYTHYFSWIKTVTFIYRNVTITLQQNYKVKINGRSIKLPFLYYPYIDIRKSKRYIYVYTKDGISLKWDGDSYIEVNLPKKFMNRMCGLCGNYNGNPHDDFVLPNRVEALTPNQFGDYWRLKKSNACKRHANAIRNVPQHSTCFGWRLFRAHQICKRAFSDRSILPCKWRTPSVADFQDCVTDVCQCPTGKQHCECGAIRSYYEKCSKTVKNLTWKRKDRCDTSCSGGSIYSSCGPGCVSTCDSINSFEFCNKPCVAGCHCPAGFVWHNNKCILQFNCPNYKKKR